MPLHITILVALVLASISFFGLGVFVGVSWLVNQVFPPVCRVFARIIQEDVLMARRLLEQKQIDPETEEEIFSLLVELKKGADKINSGGSWEPQYLTELAGQLAQLKKLLEPILGD